MNTKTVYSTKAENYAKYRWDYARNSIEAIFEIAQLSSNSSIADIGAGTGILTKHFVSQVQKIYTIEPNIEMRQIAMKELGSSPSVSVMDSSAEATKLPKQSVDLITVAQSIHWFDPKPAKQEMLRILKENGWLAIIKNYGTDENFGKAIGRLMTEEYGADFSATIQRPKEKPVKYYYGNSDFQKITFPFQFHQSCEEFIGALTSASFMPDEENPLFKKLEREAKKIFSQYRNDGFLIVRGETELFIGQPSKQTENAS